MFYTYVLFSLKSEKLYVGSTDDLKRRFTEHNSGAGGKYTKSQKPFKLIYYEAYLMYSEAKKQERFYKTGYGREVLHGKLEKSLESLKGEKQ